LFLFLKPAVIYPDLWSPTRSDSLVQTLLKPRQHTEGNLLLYQVTGNHTGMTGHLVNFMFAVSQFADEEMTLLPESAVFHFAAQ
jgi:hypothetical protein